MDILTWKDSIIDKAKRQICYRNNMSVSEKNELSMVLSDFLDEGISLLKQWRKLKNEEIFTNGEYDNGLINYIKNKYSANGRELYSDYSSGGVKSKMDKSPESILKSTYKQVI